MLGTLLHEGVTQVKTTQRREYSKIMASPSLDIEQKVGRNKRSVSGMDDRAGNGLRLYPGRQKPVYLLAQMKIAIE